MARASNKPSGRIADTTAHAPRLLIRASAGTGKTFQLSTRYIAQLIATSPDRILATTFTRKAAGEILERILLRLADASVDDTSRTVLAGSLGRRSLPRNLCRQTLAGLVRNLHRVRVSTLDSFFSRVAGSFALELGLPAGWRLLDTVEDVALRDRAIESVLREGDRHDLVQLVQLLSKGEAVRSVTDLVRDTVNELYAVYLETTADAWRPIEGPLPLSSAALRQAIDDLRTADLPANKHWSNSHQKDVAAAEAGDGETFVEKGSGNKILDGESKYYNKPITDSLREIYSRLLNHAAAIECRILSDQHRAARDLLQRFDATYTRLKHDAAGLTFDDVARRLAAELSLQKPTGLAFRLDAQLEHLLLDESLGVQQRLVFVGGGSSFFCVGDVKQAIYGWRGGVAEIFDTVTNRLAGLTESQLDASFRSSSPVIETVNTVFQPRTDFPLMPDHEAAFVDWVNRFPEHTTQRSDVPGYACLVVGPQPGPQQSAKEAVFAGAADFLAELFPKLPPDATVGVLARKNDAVGRLVRELRQRGLPASEEGGNPLTDSAGVQIVLSAMKLADHPEHSIARYHVAHSPLGPVLELPVHADPADVCEVAAHIRRQLQADGYGAVVSRWTDAFTPHCNGRELDRLRQLTALADDYDALATLRPSDFVRYVEASRIEDPRTAPIRVMTVHKAKGLEFDVVLLPQLDEILFQPRPTFVAFREHAAEAAVRICRYRNKSMQRLLPPDIQDAFRQTDERELREALSVLYVSLTRAAKALYMFVAPSAKSSKSYAGILRTTLAAPEVLCREGAVLYECGDPQWHQHAGEKTETIEPAPASVAAAEPIRVPATGTRRRGRETRAPSQLKSHRMLSIGDVLRPADSRVLDRGRLLHAWFEAVEWIDDGPPDDETLRRTVARYGFPDQLIDENAGEFRRLLQTDGLRGVLTRSLYHPTSAALFTTGLVDGDDVELTVQRERRFDVPLDDALVSGSIDRLVLFKRGGNVVAADVLDYKSDAVYGDPQAEVARLVATYSGQLDCYARAVAQMYGLPRPAIATRLVLLATQQVVNVPPPHDT